MTGYNPWFKSPFTDLTGDLMSHQYFGNCAELEMKMVDCLEAYGLDRGIRKCDDLLKDYKECAKLNKQMDRIETMRIERHRQWLKGERSSKDHYAPGPAPDSYPL